MKIALLGEYPTDSESVKNLFSRHYAEAEFKTLLFGIHGSNLDDLNNQLRRLIRIEYEDYQPDLLIFIRDLDGLNNTTGRKKKRKLQSVFSKIKSIVEDRAIFMLNIYELEALILADVQTFNQTYLVDLQLSENAMDIPEPKEILKKATAGKSRKHDPSHNPEIFEKIDFKIIQANHAGFRLFVKRFEKWL